MPDVNDLEFPKEEGKCDECQGKLLPAISMSSPTSSELYCDPCHKSYRMSNKEFEMFSARLTPLQEQRPRAARPR
jgi:excinuclease UvrABC ATPase subunit